LLHHRERVVAKDELLDVLWPGVIVVDSALQRVVSLARSTLREGGAEGAIRTHARHGYRICADGVEESGGSAALRRIISRSTEAGAGVAARHSTASRRRPR
jgi:DNA-binding winged helix-turn-helix (wHTH) protein